MLLALLILIVFILLFGAGAVKGWLTNAAGLGCGFAILIGLVLWVGSFFGPDGPEYVIFGGMGLLLVLAIWFKATEPVVRPPEVKPPQEFHSRAPSREERKRLREQHRDGPRGG